MKTIKELTKLSNGKELDIKYPIVMRDADGRQVYCEDSGGFWWKTRYIEGGRRIRHENSTGYWFNAEYDENDREVYHEDSEGNIYDNRKERS